MNLNWIGILFQVLSIVVSILMSMAQDDRVVRLVP